MALGTTNITTALVRSTLAEAINKVFGLCTSANINKWSRYKPTTGTRPGGTSGKFGLNVPTNWNIIPITNAGRLGDYRGYEHDKDVAGPVIWCLSSDASVPASITPNITGSGGAGSFIAHMNTVHNDLRILLSDLGYGSYYWGVMIAGYYKTFGVVSDGVTMSWGITLDFTDPENPTFTDLPLFDAGTIQWRLFISSAASANWSASQPAGYIEFPGGTGETYGSKTIRSAGSFTLTEWIAAADGSMGWAWNEGTYTNYIATTIHVSHGSAWHIDTIPTGFSIKDSGGADLSVASTGLSGAEVRIFPTTNNGTTSPIGPSSFIFHDEDHNVVEIEVLQGAMPEPVAVTVNLKSGGNASFEAYEYSGQSDFDGSNTIHLVLVVDYNDLDDLSQHSMGYIITHNGTPAGSGNVTIEASIGTPTLVDVVLTGGMTVDTGDTVIVEIDAVTPN